MGGINTFFYLYYTDSLNMCSWKFNICNIRLDYNCLDLAFKEFLERGKN